MKKLDGYVDGILVWQENLETLEELLKSIKQVKLTIKT
jgi:hypothetical protein